jgi:hypothetical protein
LTPEVTGPVGLDEGKLDRLSRTRALGLGKKSNQSYVRIMEDRCAFSRVALAF